MDRRDCPCWDIAETCLVALSEKNLRSATLGLAGIRRLMPYEQWRKISEALEGATLVDAEASVDRFRCLKSEREIGQVRHAARIVHSALAGLETVNESLIAARLMRGTPVGWAPKTFGC